MVEPAQQPARRARSHGYRIGQLTCHRFRRRLIGMGWRTTREQRFDQYQPRRQGNHAHRRPTAQKKCGNRLGHHRHGHPCHPCRLCLIDRITQRRATHRATVLGSRRHHPRWRLGILRCQATRGPTRSCRRFQKIRLRSGFRSRRLARIKKPEASRHFCQKPFALFDRPLSRCQARHSGAEPYGNDSSGARTFSHLRQTFPAASRGRAHRPCRPSQ